MQASKLIPFCISLLWLASTLAQAETVYVIDELNIGLHEDKTIESPISKLVPSGTALTVMAREDDLVQVKEPGGTQGWVNAKYIVSEKPGRILVLELKTRNEALQKEIKTLKSNSTSTKAANSEKQLKQLTPPTWT